MRECDLGTRLIIIIIITVIIYPFCTKCAGKPHEELFTVVYNFISPQKGKGRGIEVEWGGKPWWKGVETGESFDRQERVIMVQMEDSKAPRTERGLAA